MLGSMDSPPPACKLTGLRLTWLMAWMLVLCWTLPASARVLTAQAERVATPVARLDALELSLRWPPGQRSGELSLTAAVLDAGELGYRWRDLAWRCELSGAAVEELQCAGPVSARSASGARLTARLEQGALTLELTHARTRLTAHQPLQSDAETGIEVLALPAAWLAPLLARAWSDGHITAGRIDAQWTLRQHPEGIDIGGPLRVDGLGLDSADGRIAAEGAGISGRAQARLATDATTLDLALELRGGEFLFGPMYAQLPATPVELAARLSSSVAGRWQVEGLRWRDPGVLQFDGRLQLDTAQDMPLREAALEFSLPDLGAAHARYFDSLSASFGFSGLQLGGNASGELQWSGGDWQALDLALEAVDIEDGNARFGADGIGGTLRLRNDTDSGSGELAWRRAHLHRIELGAARLPLDSSGGGLALRSPVSIPLLGGQLLLQQMRYAPVQGEAQLALALELENADLAQLSQVLDWPAFSGRISGELPGVRYANDRLEFAGGLHVEVFDGDVHVAQLAMERPFGVAPTLAASVDVRGLDLEPLTGAFGIGEISGRLDGHIHDLRLVDWEPVAFDAAFHTVERRGVRQRISQRAVRELTEVGGGGLAAGLQAQVLKAFSSFGYEHIGLSCVLANNVCTMGGVGPAENGGYYIVEGSGLPRVHVIGHQNRVDWPVLVARLKAASQGQVPVFD